MLGGKAALQEGGVTAEEGRGARGAKGRGGVGRRAGWVGAEAALGTLTLMWGGEGSPPRMAGVEAPTDRCGVQPCVPMQVPSPPTPGFPP